MFSPIVRLMLVLVCCLALLAASPRTRKPTAEKPEAANGEKADDPQASRADADNAESEAAKPVEKGAASGLVRKTDRQWRRLLTRKQYLVTRQKATERPFSGKYWKTKTPGVYRCVCCDAELFSSETKFDSGTGWPSFWAPLDEQNLKAELDRSYNAWRVEVLCSRCDAHLGHVFRDGPPPTGLRFCINSAALELEEAGRGDSPSNHGAEPGR